MHCLANWWYKFVGKEGVMKTPNAFLEGLFRLDKRKTIGEVFVDGWWWLGNFIEKIIVLDYMAKRSKFENSQWVQEFQDRLGDLRVLIEFLKIGKEQPMISTQNSLAAQVAKVEKRLGDKDQEKLVEEIYRLGLLCELLISVFRDVTKTDEALGLLEKAS